MARLEVGLECGDSVLGDVKAVVGVTKRRIVLQQGVATQEQAQMIGTLAKAIQISESLE